LLLDIQNTVMTSWLFKNDEGHPTSPPLPYWQFRGDCWDYVYKPSGVNGNCWRVHRSWASFQKRL